MSEGTKCDRPSPTRLVAPRLNPGAQTPDVAHYGFEERLALFACALHRDSALEMLEGLKEKSRARAREHARRVAAWDSPTRQAKVALHFGLRRDASERLRVLMGEASAALQREIYLLLPAHQRTLFPDFVLPNPSEPAPPALVAFAHRLIKEATR